MPKQTSSAQIHVADGVGGMRQVADLRFEDGEWPIELVVPASDAENWVAHLEAEAEERGWSSRPRRIVGRLRCIRRTDRLPRHWTSFGKGHAAKNSDFERGRVATLRRP
jgi:hypothetical protein